MKQLSNLKTHQIWHRILLIQKLLKKRKCDDNYLSYGFAWTGNEKRPNGLCVEYETVISNASLFPAKLKQHVEKKHS